MRIRPSLPADGKKLKAAFPSLKAKPTVRGVSVLCEDRGEALAYAWAEPVAGAKGRWEVRFLGARPDHRGLGLESQVLLTLELEIEKKAGRSLSVWTAADLLGDPGDFLRDLVRPRGYRFREYDSGYQAKTEPADRYEKELHPDDFPVESDGTGDDGEGEGPRPRFPLISLN